MKSCAYCGEERRLFKVLTYIGEREFTEFVCKDCRKSLQEERERRVI